MKDYLKVGDLSEGDLVFMLDQATRAKLEPDRDHDLLRGEIVFCYFAKPSTRTRISFAAAAARLGGAAQFVGPEELQIGRGETIEDTARVVSRYAAAAVIRTYSDSEVERFARAASIPVINALTDRHHPCQALADLLTLRERFHHLAGLRIAYVGAGNNVAHSLMEGAALSGMHFVAACPSAFPIAPDLLDRARSIAERTGASVDTTEDPSRAVKEAEAVYTDVWLSMGDRVDEQARRRRILSPFQVNEKLMSGAAERAVFLHCLPAHRGDEVTASVLDGPRSVVMEQAANRLYTAQALLRVLKTDGLRGGSE